MSSSESQQKMAAFHHPVRPDILQAITDTGGVTDGSIISELEALSPFDPQTPLNIRINLTIQKYKTAYSAFREARRRGGSKRQLKKQADAIVKAEQILKPWLPFLLGDQFISGEMADFIAKGKLSEWFKHRQPHRG